MAVRPFYVEADIDGRKTNLKGGPKSSIGCATISVYQRNQGSVDNPYKIDQKHRYGADGTHYLLTEVYFNGEKIHEYKTEY